MKKLRNISLLLTLVIFLSNFNLIPVKATENLDKLTVSQESIGEVTAVTPVTLQDPSELSIKGGYIPTAIKVKKSSYPFNKGLFKATVLPEKYDLRSFDYVTPVRNQGSIGACWTFSTYGSLESTIKKASSNAYDFSEIHMAVYNGETGPNDGGNNHIATAYLVSGKGPILESEAPYPNPPTVDNINVRDDLKPQYRVKDIIFLPSRENALDNEEIKNAIITYGAVSSSYYDNSAYYNYGGQTSYYNNSTKIANHAITIVGWDDNYSKNNFKIKPPGDGAFLIKNSWGDWWGDDGYFYISYYDVSLGYDSNAVFYDIENMDTYKNMYSITDKGPYGYYPVQEAITAAGNRFVAKENEYITAVGFYTFAQNISYEVWIEKNVSSSNPQSQIKVASGTLPQGGYHTIKIENPVQLSAGEEFIVWLKLSGDAYYGESDSSLALGTSYLKINSGYTQNSSVALAINAYTDYMDYSKHLSISSVSPANDEIDPNESITITFDDNISKGSDYSKISLKDENGVEVQKSITISGKNLIIKEVPENHLYGRLKLYVPKAAVKNSKGEYMYNDFSKEYIVYPAANTVVTFKDAALENAVRNRLNKYSGNITAGDMRSLETLNLYSKGVTNLSGLEYAVKLKSLDIGYNNIISIKPLSTLTALERLNMEMNLIKDISPLSNLKNLKDLNIRYNNIRDISSLSNLTSLEVLDMSYNLITNITPLEKLHNLYEIDITDNLVKDISPLKKLAESKTNENISINLRSNFIDFSQGSTARSILDSLSDMSVSCYGVNYQFYRMQVAALNNKHISIYYYNDFKVGESIVVEYNEPISLASNANSLIMLGDEYSKFDISLRAVGNTIIITPLAIEHKYSELYLIIEEGAVTSKSNPNIICPDQFIIIPIKDNLYGDVDSNGIVDILDFAAIASSYNSVLETDPGWSFEKDLNRDGVIDMYDLCATPLVIMGTPQGRAD